MIEPPAFHSLIFCNISIDYPIMNSISSWSIPVNHYITLIAKWKLLFSAFSATFRPDLYTLKQLQMYLISLIFRSATPGSEGMEKLAARTVLPDLPVQLFIILPRIPYLSATIIAIRDLPEFFRICEPVIQSPQAPYFTSIRDFQHAILPL